MPQPEGHTVKKYGNRLRDMRSLMSALSGKCPVCSVGPLYNGVFTLHETCSHCGVRFERDNGSWLGALFFAYTFTVLALGVLAAVLIVKYGLFPGIEWVLVGGSFVIVMLFYRPSKAINVWWMYGADLVQTDEKHGSSPKQQ